MIFCSFPPLFAHFANTDAAPEAVKRKIVEEATEAVADEASPTPEKKSKVDEAHENGAEAEVVA